MSDLLNQASLVMVPSGYKEDTVYSVVPSDGSGDLSFTRASNGTRINSAGLVEVCPWNMASDSNSFGGLAAITKTTGQISPIDSTSGNLLTATGSGEHYSGTASLTAIVGNTYTYSVYGKFVQGVQIALRTVFANGFDDISTIWNLSTGALVSNATDHTNPTITNVGNGWYRCSITYRPATVPAFPLLFRLQMAVGGSLSFTATSGDGFLAYGAQINNGAIAPYFPTTDRLNVPRLTYQNGGGGCPSLLLEKQSTNEASYSEQFDNAYWTKQGLTVTANSIVSPDGTQNADLLTLNTSLEEHNAYAPASGLTITSNAPFTFSCYVKKGTGRYFCTATYFTGVGFGPYATFDLNTATLVASGASFGTYSSSKIENMGNDWYRCSVTGFGPYTSLIFAPDIRSASSLIPGVPFTGAGETMYVWGAQLEASSYPTSYIPTTSSSATRVADAYSRSLSSIASGTAYINITDNVAQGSVGTHLFGPFSMTGASLGLHLSRPNGQRLRLWTQASANVFQTTETNLKLAMTWDGTNVNVYQNGVQVVTNYAYALTNVNNLFSNTNLESSATIAEIVLFNSVLTDAECISLTS